MPIATDREESRALAAVREIIADGSCSALSLDVFDTILWHRVPRPADLFSLLAARLRRNGQCPAWLTDATLHRLRIEAEHQARTSRPNLSNEVSLFDIWRAMPLSLFGTASLDELVAAEIELERELTVVDLDIAHVIELADQHGMPIVLVSDAYFTESQLTSLLDRPELKALQGARVFRSHQRGTDKKAELWSVVLNALGVRPEQLVHVGDHEKADHSVPAELGIRTVHYQRTDEEFARTLKREHEPLEPFGRHAPDLDPEHGDFGLTSLRAQTLVSANRKISSGADIAWRYGAAVLGPVLTGFAEWVAHTAYRSGTPVVWCPMREGEMLSGLVNAAARIRGWDVQAKPLWLSRQVVSVAALDSAEHEPVHKFIRRSHRLTVRQLLNSLRLRPGDVPALTGELDTILDHQVIVDRVSTALIETPHLQNRLMAATTAARERLLTALRNSGALDHPELTLVDLGWGATIQYYLAQALRIAGIDVTPAGLYLVTDRRSTRTHLAGLRTEGYLAQAGHPHDVSYTVSRSPEVLEQSVNALCGSLIDFTDDGSPVLGPSASTPTQDRERREVQDGIRAFQCRWNRYVERFPWPDLTEAARPHLARILVSALRAPTADEARVFGNWQHEDNFGSSVVTRVLPEDLAAAVPYLSPNDLAELDMRDAFWPRLLAASDPHLGAATRALDTGLVDPAMFDPTGDPFETRLDWRTGDGRWHQGPRKRVRINHNGLSFARLNLEEHDMHDVHEVALALPGRPAVVRVDWIEAKVIAGGRQVPEVLRWETAEDIAGLVMAECIYLGGTMVEFETPHSALWLPLSASGGGPVSSAQISAGFAMLPRSRSGFEHRIPPVGKIMRLSSRARAEYRARGLGGLAEGAKRLVTRRLS